MKLSVDLTKLKQLSQLDYGWIRHTTYELERVDMGSKVKLVKLHTTEENGTGFVGDLQAGGVAPAPAQWKETRRRRSISIRKKYLCIGGPLDSQMATSEDAVDYIFYSRSIGGRRQKVPTGVLIHKYWIGIKTGLEW